MPETGALRQARKVARGAWYMFISRKKEKGLNTYYKRIISTLSYKPQKM
jgi:hypothetical protein